MQTALSSPASPTARAADPTDQSAGGDACRIGGRSCDRPDHPSCGCRAAQQHLASHGARASSGGHRQAAPKQHGASGTGGSDDDDDDKGLWGTIWGGLKDFGETVYEVSGAKDLVDGCFRDPAVVGCIKGVLEVGVVFVPGGAAVRGGELAVAGGARLIEGEVGAGSLAFVVKASREEAKAAAYDRAGVPAGAQPDAVWMVGDDITRRGTPDSRYDANNLGAHGNCEQFETEGGSRVNGEHTNDPEEPDSPRLTRPALV